MRGRTVLYCTVLHAAVRVSRMPRAQRKVDNGNGNGNGNGERTVESYLELYNTPSSRAIAPSASNYGKAQNTAQQNAQNTCSAVRMTR